MNSEVSRQYRQLLLAAVVPFSTALLALGSYEMLNQPAVINAYCVIAGLCLTLVFSHWLVWRRLIVPTSKQLQTNRVALQQLYDNTYLKNTIIDALQDAVIIIDERLRIIEWSAGARRIFTDPENTASGRDLVNTLIPAQSQNAFLEQIKRFFLADEKELALANSPLTFEVNGIRLNNQAIFPAQWMMIPLQLPNRRLLAFHVRDLSVYKHTEAEIIRQQGILSQAEKMTALSSLLAGVAHELNNPLAIVMGRAIMLQDQSTSPAVANGINKIRDAAERCARIVKTFISMAKQSASEPGWMQCNDIIESVCAMSEQSLRNQRIELTLDLADDLPGMWADDVQLSQVMMNLIVNAQQALLDNPDSNPRSLLIKTSFEQDSSHLRIDVKDNGPGIAKTLHSRVFEPFFTTKEGTSGMGIGLSSSFSIVQSHRGTLTLLDDEAEHGAHFVIRLPLAPILRR